MFARLVRESFVRNPRRKVLTAAALVVGMAVATATLSVALDVGDRLAREFRSLGANLLVTPQSDTLPLEIGGVDYRPVDEGAYLSESSLGKLKAIFWRNNIIGFSPFLDVPAVLQTSPDSPSQSVELVGTWYQHAVPVPDGTTFTTGVASTHPWWKIRGRWFHDGEKECVAGSALAERFPGEIAPGKTLYIRPSVVGKSAADNVIPLLITGIVSTGNAEDNSLIVPLSVAQGLSGHPGEFRQLFVSALTKPADALSERDPATMTPEEHDRWYCSPYISSISAQMETALPGTSVHAIRRVAETEGKILTRVGALFWLVTLGAIFAAALAVAATSATTILERRAEVGVMKALGASNYLVAAIFLAEQLILALAGGAFGFLCGIFLARTLGTSIFGSPAATRPILFPVVLGLAALVAAAGSLIPLRRAMNFQPAPILRGE
ncbi:MAG TPA: ABC transporter permease [Candidatus Acidoferrum sp.]|nr:ABC transporter permease [Candidatus Acidoferrum sp.]